MNPSTANSYPSPASFHRRKAKITRRRMAGPRRSPSKYGTQLQTTPLLRWKLENEDQHGSLNTRGRLRLQFPARKLAAGLWQSHYKEISSGGGGKALKRRASQREKEILHGRHHHGRAEAEAELHRLQSPYYSLAHPNSGIQRKVTALKREAETETRNSDASLVRLYSEEQPFVAASRRKSELLQAQTRIRKLESRQRYSKKKVELLKGKLEEEKALLKSRRHLKLGVVIDELQRERKTRQKVEILNANLVKELTDAKGCAKKYKQEYEKEKKSRVVMEEVCEELAKQIVEDKAKVEALKEESMKLCEKLEEERKMLQMAEVWREERIQMKLIDAKLALEDKYLQMNRLITDLENFLMSRSEKLDVMELRRAELIQQAAKSVSIADIEDLFYEPQTHNLMLSLLEDLKQTSNYKEIQQCHDSRLNNSSPRLDSFNRISTESQAVKSAEELPDDAIQGRVSESNTKCIETPCHVSSNEASEICLTSSKQTKTKEKTIEESRSGRFSTLSSEGELNKCRESTSQRISLQQEETINPHVRRGTQGCIEWPRGIQRSCFKIKPLDARIESQKSQLRHVLKRRVK